MSVRPFLGIYTSESTSFGAGLPPFLTFLGCFVCAAIIGAHLYEPSSQSFYSITMTLAMFLFVFGNYYWRHVAIISNVLNVLFVAGYMVTGLLELGHGLTFFVMAPSYCTYMLFVRSYEQGLFFCVLLWMFFPFVGAPVPGVHIRALLSSIFVSGVTLYFIITRKRYAKLKEEEKNRANSASKYKSRFLAAMSHELRTPLTAVIGGVNILRQNRSLSSSDVAVVDAICESAELLMDLIGNILDHARAESGKLRIQHVVFDLKKCVSSCVNIMSNRAQMKGLALDVEWGEGMEDIHSDLVGDSVRIQQVLLNLLSNSVKFTERGSVTLHVSRDIRRRSIESGFEAILENDNSSEDIDVLFEVTDTGIGIKENEKEQLFHRFAQLETGIESEGSGLGLVVSRGIVQAMDGRMGFVSNMNRSGSTFWFSLPLPEHIGKEDDVTEEEFDVCEYQKEVSSVLLVEDNSHNQFVIRLLLESLGVNNVLIANDGLEGLDAFMEKKGEFDMVFMDCRMPRMNGLEATRLIRDYEETVLHRPFGDRVSIVALTASAISEVEESCREAGMVRLLSVV